MFQQGQAEKRGVGAMQDDDQARLLKSIRDIVKEENKTIADAFDKRMTAIESRQEQLEHRIEKIELKLGRSPGEANVRADVTTSFKPSFVEVKGFCSWSERLSKGASRADAAELMSMLTPLLPTDLQQHVGLFTLRGLRNYSVQIPVDSNFIREIKGIWSDAMKAKQVTGPNACELFITMQKSPQQQRKYAAMGRLFEFVKSHGQEKGIGVKAFWAPDFCIYAEPKDAPPVLLASLDQDNNVKWEESCEANLGLSAKCAADALSIFRRR